MTKNIEKYKKILRKSWNSKFHEILHETASPAIPGVVISHFRSADAANHVNRDGRGDSGVTRRDLLEE